jgi:hypothetical protein
MCSRILSISKSRRNGSVVLSAALMREKRRRGDAVKQQVE